MGVGNHEQRAAGESEEGAECGFWFHGGFYWKVLLKKHQSSSTNCFGRKSERKITLDILTLLGSFDFYVKQQEKFAKGYSASWFRQVLRPGRQGLCQGLGGFEEVRANARKKILAPDFTDRHG
jgi:hypothetical protein